jgi:hypothetical protein
VLAFLANVWCMSICVALLSARVAQAQGTAATIEGRVTDESGAVMPGVTVTVKSPALQVPEMSAVTDASGEYRISPLPIGTYTVEFELSGFQAIRHEDLRLTIGFTARQDVVLKVGSLQETITVSGVSPVVDVTATNASTQFTRETLEVLPTGRNGITSLLAQAPGARATWDVGGSAATEQPIFRAFGQGGEPWPTTEGVVTGAFGAGTNGVGNYIDYGALEEARVSTLGNDAEMPTRGISLQAIVKSGSNALHGSYVYGRYPTAWQADNLPKGVQESANVNAGRPIIQRYDTGGDLGGKLVENKVWWYGALRRRHDIQSEFTGVKDDGTPAENNQLHWFHTEKLSYQMTSSNKLVMFYTHAHKWDVSEASELRAWSAKSNKPTYTDIGKIEWQSIRGNSLVVALQGGGFMYRTPYFTNDTGPYATDVKPGPSATDIFTQYTWGTFTNTGRRAKEYSFQYKGSVGWFRPHLFAGDHDLKSGFEYIAAKTSGAYVKREAGNYQLVFNNGAPFQLRTWNSPTTPNDNTRYLGLFLKDSWTIRRRLTLNLGIRYAYNPGFIPADCRDAVDFAPASCWDRISFKTWNSAVPRLHAAYDVMGDGRTVIKGGWGRFQHMRYVGEVATADPNTRSTTTWTWRDLNGNRDYNPGEVNLDPNGSDFVSQSGGSNTVPNPDEVQPMYDELSASIERELMRGFGIRFTSIYSRTSNPYRTVNLLRPPSVYTRAITGPDPGGDGVVGTADDPGTTFTYYEYPTSLRGRAFEKFTTVNDRNATPTFTSFEIAGSKRLANNWQFLASYSATKRNIPYINGLDPSEQGSSVTLASLDPNSEINASDRTWEWTGKAQGAYIFPYQLLVSTSFEHRSGEPWARQVLFRGGTTIPTITLRVEPIGAQRLPDRNLMNMRIQKTLRLTAAQKVELRMNIYNLLNSNTAINVNKRSGPTYLTLQPLDTTPAIMEPRIFELTLGFTF